MTDEVRHVPLEHRHRELGAKLVPFGGFLMPLQYAGIKEEHLAVRERVGLFDVSHMGEVEFRGPDAISAVDYLVTNDVTTLEDGQAMYSAMCNERGGIVDDLVLYRLAGDHILVCVNAANRDKDVAHMKNHVRGNVEMTDNSDAYVQLALQGPRAQDVLSRLTGADLDQIEYYRGAYLAVGGNESFVSRTGYTGEDGFEIYTPVAHGEAVFDAVIEAGGGYDLQMCGLGARDTLRLEAKYLLYGQDMDESTNPFEAGLSWVVKLDRDADFVGKEALAEAREQGVERRLRGLILKGRGIIRHGYPIYTGDERIGEVTSGSYAPSLEESIGLGYVDVAHANDDVVEIEIRGRRVEAALTKKPFYRRD